MPTLFTPAFVAWLQKGAKMTDAEGHEHSESTGQFVGTSGGETAPRGKVDMSAGTTPTSGGVPRRSLAHKPGMVTSKRGGKRTFVIMNNRGDTLGTFEDKAAANKFLKAALAKWEAEV